MLRSYRNQSIDLHCKSSDWFLYEGNIDLMWVYQNIYHTKIRKENLKPLIKYDFQTEFAV